MAKHKCGVMGPYLSLLFRGPILVWKTGILAPSQLALAGVFWHPKIHPQTEIFSSETPRKGLVASSPRCFFFAENLGGSGHFDFDPSFDISFGVKKPRWPEKKIGNKKWRHLLSPKTTSAASNGSSWVRKQLLRTKSQQFWATGRIPISGDCDQW